MRSEHNGCACDAFCFRFPQAHHRQVSSAGVPAVPPVPPRPGGPRGPVGHRVGSAGYRRITLALFAAGMASFAQMYSAQAVLPQLAGEFGVSPARATLAVSATTLMIAVAIVPASVLSERYGRVPVMTVSVAVSTGLGLLIPLSPSFGVLVAARTLQGAAVAGVPAVAMAYLAEEVHRDAIGAAMGRYIAGTTLGGLFGRLVAALAVDVTSWRWALEIAAIGSAVFAAAFVWCAPASRRFVSRGVHPAVVGRNLRTHLRQPALLALFTVGLLLMGGFVSVYNLLGFRLLAPPFALPAAVVGLVFCCYLAGTVGSAMAGRLADRRGRGPMLLAAVGITAAGLALTWPDWLPTILAGVLIFTAGFFAAHAVASGWVGRIAVVHRAEASALYLLGYYTGSAVGGTGAALAYAAGGWTGCVVYVGSLLAVSAGLAVLLLLRGRDRPASAVAETGR